MKLGDHTGDTDREELAVLQNTNRNTKHWPINMDKRDDPPQINCKEKTDIRIAIQNISFKYIHTYMNVPYLGCFPFSKVYS